MNIRQGVIALLLATLSGAALAADSEASADEAAFNQLKSLVGTWEGREKDKPESEIIRIAYESVSGGKTVIERMMPDQLEGRWTFFADGKEKGAMHLLLQKK